MDAFPFGDPPNYTKKYLISLGITPKYTNKYLISLGLTPKYTNKYVNIFLGSVNCPITPITITYVCVFLDACPFGDPPNYTKKS